jgi:hypothetical protein
LYCDISFTLYFLDLSDQHVEDFHSLQQHKVKRPSPFGTLHSVLTFLMHFFFKEDSIKCNKLDNFIIHHSEQNRRQTVRNYFNQNINVLFSR